jgi:hypothetical protein
MVTQATGRIVRDDQGLELLIERRITAPADDVWQWLTVASNLAKWMPAPKSLTTTILEPGKRVRFEGLAGEDPWRIELAIAEVIGVTTVFASHRLSGARQAGDVGPMWEFILDRLVAAHGGHTAPSMDDYFPSQRPYFERIAMDGDPVGWPTT